MYSLRSHSGKLGKDSRSLADVKTPPPMSACCLFPVLSLLSWQGNTFLFLLYAENMICILRHAHFMIFHEPARSLAKRKTLSLQANWAERESFLKIPIKLQCFPQNKFLLEVIADSGVVWEYFCENSDKIKYSNNKKEFTLWRKEESSWNRSIWK